LKTRYSPESPDSKELILKVDNIQMADKLVKVVDLEHAIADALETTPSALQLVSVEEGCVLLKFLISTATKSALTKLTLYQHHQLSIISLKCGDYELNLGHSGEGVFLYCIPIHCRRDCARSLLYQ
jgi:hypothetical protein